MTTAVTVRLDDELAKRVDALVVELSSRVAGLKLNRSDAIRVALERGIDVLERENKRTK